jgi:large subunit ribosomal protein L13
MTPMKMTASLKVAEAKHEWVLLDAADATLGRLSTQIATLLRGKHKPTWWSSMPPKCA